jgi:hypothetical protein
MESEKLLAPIIVSTQLKELICKIEQGRSARPYRMPEPLCIQPVNAVSEIARLDHYQNARVRGALNHDFMPQRVRLNTPRFPPWSLVRRPLCRTLNAARL